MVRMKKYYSVLLLISAFLLMLTPACEKHYANSTSDEEQTDDSGTGTDGSEAASDYEWVTSDVVYITLNATSITVDGNGATVSGSTVTITAAGTYSISGTLTNGQVIVDTNDDGVVRIILNGVDITCSSSSPVYVKDAAKAVVILADNTTNNLTDGTSYVFDDTEKQEPDAAVFSKSFISFYGNGALVVKGNYADGIVGKDGLVIKSGNITVTSKDDGIRGKDYIIVRDGKITVTSTGDGLKSSNEDDTSLGYISIDKGTFNITSGGDAISAPTNVTVSYADMTIKSGGGSGSSTTTQGYSGTVSAKGIKADASIVINDGIISVNSADDALHSPASIIVNGGSTTLSTMDDAIHAEGSLTVSGGTINITKCYEGFEGPAINISGGNINLVSTDDSFNGTKGMATETSDGSAVNISGGTILLNPSTGDGLDSNGNVTMTGGTVIVQGPSSQPEVCIDVNGTFNISGGLFIGSGPNSGQMIEASSSTSSQYCVLAKSTTTLSAGTIVNIQDTDNKSLVTFKPVRSIYYIVFSSPDLASGSSYYIYTGGSSTGTSTGGLYVGGIYSGGTQKKNFTVSGKVTTVSF